MFDLDAGTGRYRPTELGAQMRDDAPGGIRPILDITCAGGRAELAFVELPETVRTNEPAYPRRYGRDLWSDLESDTRLRRSFDEQMNWRFQVQAPQLAERYDWSRFPSILDVGGGDGMVLAEILSAHSAVHGKILDLPPTAGAAAARFADIGLADRAGAISGSFFEPLPGGFDAYLLSDIVHDWDDDQARRILGHCAEAAGTTGTILLIEPIRGQGASTAIDLFMLMCFGGKERTVIELAELGASVGLTLRTHQPVADGRTLLEFTAV